MAYTQSVKYVYPSNFSEGSDTMNPDQRRICVQVDGVVATSGNASDAVVVDKSDLQGPDGSAEPSALVIERLEWQMNGFTEVTLEWAESSNELIARLSPSQGTRDYRAAGGLVPSSDFADAGDGDIVLSTVGASDTDNLSILIWARLKE